jgi:tetratricopeptide (TPR) repeat protein
MSVHLARAEILLAQSRPADAEREARQALAANPHDASAHAFLALCCAQLGRHEDALMEARMAVGLAADEGAFHRVLGFVLHRAGRQLEAMKSAEEALRLNPLDAHVHVLKASIHLARRSWTEAAESAEAALALDPEHVEAANFRAMALIQLGRKQEAAATVEHALRHEPENALSHANQGWNCLHRNDPRAAKEHFREALRLDPELDYAREGMLEALKARNPVYRVMLAYFLWMGRQASWLQWALVFGVFFGGRIVTAIDRALPAGFGWVIVPLYVLFYGFIYLSWTAQPLFNLMLRLDPFGRHVLSADQRRGSTYFGISFGLVLGALAWWFTAGHSLGPLVALDAAIVSLCVAATVNRTGRIRLLLGTATAVLAGLATAALVLLSREEAQGSTLHLLFVYAFIAFQFAALGLRNR